LMDEFDKEKWKEKQKRRNVDGAATFGVMTFGIMTLVVLGKLRLTREPRFTVVLSVVWFLLLD
jgi:hypothetical protein